MLGFLKGGRVVPRRPSSVSQEIVDSVAQLVEPDDDSLKDWVRSYAQNHRVRLAHDLDMVIARSSRGNRILELGSIPLILTGAMKRCERQVDGVDIDPTRFQSSQKALDVRVHRCNIENEPLPFDSNIYDLVLFNELLEHLRMDPLYALREVKRVLRPEGLLMLSTPNLKSAVGIKNFLIHSRAEACSANPYKEYSKLETLGHMGHVREYTPIEVVELLQDIGFRAEKIIFRGHRGRGFQKFLTGIFPSLRPFMSVFVRKVVKN